jgi:hypothetical protein
VLRTGGGQQVEIPCDVRQAVLVPQSAALRPIIARMCGRERKEQ